MPPARRGAVESLSPELDPHNGICNAVTGLAGPESRPTLAEKVQHMAETPLRFVPGTQWKYSPGHDVLGRLIEIWTGMEYSAFLQKEIFIPLGMVDTGFGVPKSKRHRLVQLCSYEATPDSAGRLYTQASTAALGVVIIHY